MRFALSVVVLASLLVLACGGDDDDADAGVSGNGAATSIAADATATPETAADKPTPEAPPAGVTDEPVKFETPDGVELSGHLYSSAGPKQKVVVLAHEFPKEQSAWKAFAEKLAAMGIDALTFDFRGYPTSGGDFDATKIDIDLEYAVRFIGSRDYAKVYVFGASMGGTAAIKVASRLDIAGLVTLSAPDAFMGLDAREDVAAVTGPKLFLAAEGDGGAPDAVEFFAAQAQPPFDTIIFPGGEHGTDILRGDAGADLETALLTFLEVN
jgi:pimeloyl-ACP methyl ester carboxylesterase